LTVHTLVSNVPGPQTAMYFCGARMVDTTTLGPVLDGMADAVEELLEAAKSRAKETS
jgi:WS/DGAT C-terminal domain